MRFGALVLRSLERMGVTHVFGIPGVHNMELFRALAGSSVTCVVPRHEQGAGFMADGYARVSGRPAASFIVSGPGMTNIVTAMGQAYADSIPMLVISSVNARAELGSGNGHLHELNSQSALVSGVCAFSHTLLDLDEWPHVLGRAFAVFASSRPRPVHIEIPVDLLGAMAPFSQPPEIVLPSRPAPSLPVIAEAASTLGAALRPIIVAGGGAVSCRDSLTRLAEGLDAPLVTTANGKGLIALGHALSVGFGPSSGPVKRLLAEADVVLVVGSELGPTDFDTHPGERLALGEVVRIDIDPQQLLRNCLPTIAVQSDAALGLDALLRALGPLAREAKDGAGRVATVRAACEAELSATAKKRRRLIDVIRDSADDPVIVGDSTEAVYGGNRFYESASPRSWFNAATGFGTLGYALPAAIGAKLAAPTRPVACLIGDGGFQFTSSELATAVEAGLPIAIVLWNNAGYGAIRRHMVEASIDPVAVDLRNPDFLAIAAALGCRAARPSTAEALSAELQAAHRADGPTLIEIRDPGPLLEE